MSVRKTLQSYAQALRLGPVTPAGALEIDGPTQYTHETRFENIKPKINVTQPTTAPLASATVQRGVLADGVDITVVKNSGEAVTQGLKKRADDSPQNDREGELFKKGHALLMTKLHKREEIAIDEATITAYLKTCSTNKAEKLGKVWSEADFDLEAYNMKMIFAKTEVLVKGHGAQPRIVYQGTDLYNLLMGVQMYVLSHRIAEELSETNPLNTGNRIIYACGLSSEQTSAVFDRYPGTRIENDMSRNDSTQAMWMRKYEAMFYKKLGASDWFVREFAKHLTVNVWTRFGLAAAITGQRWSGEVPTTPGNSYVNACQTLAYLDEIRISQSVSVVYGDDGLTITRQRVADDAVEVIQKSIADSGMVGKPVIHTEPERATFLRKRYVLGPNGHRPVPQVGRVLAKINVRGNFNTAVDDRSYAAGKYLSAAYEHRHMPQIRERLLETARRLSPQPYIDTRNQSVAAFGKSPDQLAEAVVKSDILPKDVMDGFFSRVYGVNYEHVVNEYDVFCESAVNWHNLNTRMIDGKSKTRRDPSNPPHRNSGVLTALTDLDT